MAPQALSDFLKQADPPPPAIRCLKPWGFVSTLGRKYVPSEGTLRSCYARLQFYYYGQLVLLVVRQVLKVCVWRVRARACAVASPVTLEYSTVHSTLACSNLQ